MFRFLFVYFTFVITYSETQVINNELAKNNFKNVRNLQRISALGSVYKDRIYQNLIETSQNYTISKFSVQEYSKNIQFSGKDGFDRGLCDRQLAYLFSSLSAGESWALSTIDSWGKIPAGILYGNFFDFGNFDQCIKIDETISNAFIGRIRGHYCLMQLAVDIGQIISLIEGVIPDDDINKFPLVLGIGTATCMPASCDPDYIQLIYGEFVNEYGISLAGGEYPQELYCFHPDKLDVQWDGQDIAMTCVLVIAVCLVILSSIYDYFTSKNDVQPIKALIAFSIITNGRRLFSCKQSNSPDMLNCLNGIRVLSIMWVVLGHTYNVMTQTAFLNMMYLYEWMDYFLTCIVTWATVAVDTFLLLSGLLVTWSVLKELDKNKRLNIPMMYLHRYLRLTCSLALIILLATSLYRYIGSGPFYRIQNTGLSEICQDKWWATLLYVQNYANVSRMCMGISWYLAVDMQLFWLSPLLLIPLWKWGPQTIGATITLIVLSMGCTFATYYTNDLSMNLFRMGNDSENIFSYKIYYATHTRMGSWLVGVILGYILHKTKNRRVVLTPVQFWTGWVLAIGTILSVVFGPYQINRLDYEETVIEGAIYMSCARIAWCIAVGWIIFACTKGYGGIVNSFLSLGAWMPLARLSYTIYLFHALVQLGRIGVVKNSDYFSDYYGIFNFLADFNLTTIISIVWVLLIESPLLNLEKILLSGRDSAKVTT